MNNDRQELLPCPFCGSEDIKPYDWGVDADTNGWEAYHCEECECAGAGAATRAEALAAWNTRQVPTAGLREAIYDLIAKRRKCIVPKGAETEWGEGWDACARSFCDDLDKALAAGAPEEHVHKTPENIHDKADVFKKPENLYMSQPTASVALHESGYPQAAIDIATTLFDGPIMPMARNWLVRSVTAAIDIAVAEKCGALVAALERLELYMDEKDVNRFQNPKTVAELCRPVVKEALAHYQATQKDKDTENDR